MAGPDGMIVNPNWERDSIRTFVDNLHTTDAFVDVGANVGVYSCLAANHRVPTIAIEPLPTNLSFLFSNVRRNKFESSVEILPVGTAATSGLMDLYGWADVASFVPGWFDTPTTLSTTVPVLPLDSIVADRLGGKRIFIKIDVEGFEHEVLRGSTRLIQMHPRPRWLIEILPVSSSTDRSPNPRFFDTFALFWNAGYQAFRVGPTLEPVSAEDVHRWTAAGRISGVGSANFLFVPIP